MIGNKNMKVLLLNPPYFPMYSRASRSPAVTKSSTLYYPFFLAYATGVLEDKGYDVTLIDAPAAGLDRQATIRKVTELKPDLVVCETSTPSIDNDMEVIEDIKKVEVPFVVAVGTHVSALTEEIIKENPFLDAVARREYEYTVLDLTNKLAEGGLNADLSQINGLSYRQGDKIIHNPERAAIDNLDELPFVSRVYRDHLRRHINSYFYGNTMHPVVSILTGRGCPHQCAYCVYPQTMTGHRYRLRSVTNVVNEFEFIANQLPEVREIFIEDDTLTVNRKRAQAISQEVIDRKLRVTWTTNSRADVDYETMRIMHRAGCRLLCVGFESCSQEVLDKLGKNIKRESFFEFRDDAARAGLLIHGCFMYGNEGETYETMRETLQLAKKLNCDTAQFYPIMVYPGTRAYNTYKNKGYLVAQSYRDWLTHDGLHNCVVSLPNISKEELVAFCDQSRREFYLRPGYLISKAIQVAFHPKEFRRNFRGARALLKYLFRTSSEKFSND
jgi:anaerobic magnesium-protoporphyrin IX monomethyl ester cyclase